MSVRLRLPGKEVGARDNSDSTRPDPQVEDYDAVLGTEIIAECDVGAVARGHAEDMLEKEAQADDLIELTYEGDIIELVRADQLEDHFSEPLRGDGGRLTIPTVREVRDLTRSPRDAARSTSSVALESVKHIRSSVKDAATEAVIGLGFPRLIEKLEQHHIPSPGLHQVDGSGELTPTETPEDEGPFLLLLHGTFSRTDTSFKDLFESDDWERLYSRFEGRTLALEHHTVTQSPAANALALAENLPRGAKLNILSYSRGGMVGDLLCRHPFEDELLRQFFAETQYREVLTQLETLARVLDEKQLRIERFVRVAAPAGGTLLAGKRLDTYLNVMLTVLKKLFGFASPWFGFVKAVAMAILRTRTRADALPGLEAMVPQLDKGFVPFLNCAEPRAGDLAVIAGDVRGGTLFDHVKAFFSRLYFREDNDFVVDSRSMFRGVPRKQPRGFYYRAPGATHFSYFREEPTRSRMVEYLADGRQDRFELLTAGAPYGGLRGAPAVRAIPSLKEIEQQPERDVPTVILLPGIMGTHLARDGERQWISVWQLATGGLARLAYGEPGVEPDGLVEMVYEKLFDRLREQYHVIPFGFDWRRPIQETAEALSRVVDRELKRHNRAVRIMAHSMGGLVARAFIADFPGLWETATRRGGRLVMLGTPNHGSFVPAQVFTQEHTLMKILAAADFRHKLHQLTDIVRDFQGLVEMLPYKEGVVDLLAPARWAGLGDFAPSATDLDRARQFREHLARSAIDPGSMIYVAGHDDETPYSLDLSQGGKVSFPRDALGDGTVPWDLGLLEGVPTYYVEAEHGQIPNRRELFDGFMDLLADGVTQRFPGTPPVKRPGAVDRTARGDAAPCEVQEADRGPRYYPDAADLAETVLGREHDPEKEAAPPLELVVTNGDLREARAPVMVGHYTGDRIVSAEWVIDNVLGGQLSRDHQLGRYPGPVGTVRIYGAHEGKPGAIVAGLGDVGKLGRTTLERALRAAMTEYALANVPASDAERPVELAVSSLLIGTWGGTRISFTEAVEALVHAALETNRSLQERLEGRVRICRIEIMERYRDIATAVGHAAQLIAERSQGQVTFPGQIQSRASSRRSRPQSPYGEGWSARLRVRQRSRDQHPGEAPDRGLDNCVTFQYEVTTDLARTEPYNRHIQWSNIDGLLKGAMRPGDHEAPATLFQYLLPRQLVEKADRLVDIVLDLDPATAQIPWELLDRPEGDASRPLGVRAGILRTLSTLRPRENPRRSGERRALVIGDPKGVSPQLPGALAEAQMVADLLDGLDFRVERVMNAGPDAILRALYRHRYDIVHIAAHGEYHGEDDDSSRCRSGVVIGDNRHLTSDELENLRAVPSIVFLNCCFLGAIRPGPDPQRSGLQEPGRLAASLSRHLVQMGVGVVVAAGWAVGDVTAKEFARTIYTALLSGRDLMSSVREAREVTYNAGGATDLTWGAYQVYGDPGHRLHWAGRRGTSYRQKAPRFVSCHEVIERVLDFQVRARRADERRIESLLAELRRLEQQLPATWRHRGELLSALGSAYGELGAFEEASARYKGAARDSDAPLEAVEQLADVEARQAQRIHGEDPAAAVELFKQSEARLMTLLAISQSLERQALLGATLSRWGDSLPDETEDQKSEKRKLLVRARDAFDQACEVDPVATNLYYPLSQRIALDLALDPSRVTADDIERIISSASECHQRGDELASQTLAETELLKLLRFGEGDPQQIAGQCIQALRRGVSLSPRQRDSVLRELERKVRLLQQGQARDEAEAVLKEVRRRLEPGDGSAGGSAF
jgi:pimeloyl-ACP methyl ester carboxylesterase